MEWTFENKHKIKCVCVCLCVWRCVCVCVCEENLSRNSVYNNNKYLYSDFL